MIFVLRNPPGLKIRIQHIEPKCHRHHAHRKTDGGGFGTGGVAVEAERVEDGAVEIVEEKGVMSKRAFGLDEWRPEGKRRRVSQRVGLFMRNQARGGDTVGLVVGGSEELEGDEGWGGYMR
ncbi:hypothetical protein FF1_009829 [Malus domestica]